MKKLYFVTTNPVKFENVKRLIHQFDESIFLEQANVDLLEPQSLDLSQVALFKARYAWDILRKPLLIDDGGIYLEHYNNFPGTLSKYVFEGIGLEGFWKLAKDNPKAIFSNLIVYIDGPDNYKFFEGKTYGTVIEPTQDVKNKSAPYTEIFIPDGSTKTMSQIVGTSEEKLYHRYKAVKNFVEWFSQISN